MTDLQKRFVEALEKNNQQIVGEAAELFDEILIKEFGEDPEKMTAFMESLQDNYTELSVIEKLQLENEQLKQSVKLNEATILELADMILSR